MIRSILSLSLVAGALMLAMPAAAEPQYSTARGSFVIAHNDYYDERRESWNDRTCCRVERRGGYEIFWSTIGQCYSSRGVRQTNKECRKHGGFHRYEGNYWNGHDGYGPGWGWQDGNWNDRVCCTRNGQVWWSTRGECRRYAGYETANRVCRGN